jgi:hypothetical protein
VLYLTENIACFHWKDPRHIMTTHFENLSKHIHTLHGQISEFFLVLTLAVHVLIKRL